MSREGLEKHEMCHTSPIPVLITSKKPALADLEKHKRQRDLLKESIVDDSVHVAYFGHGAVRKVSLHEKGKPTAAGWPSYVLFPMRTMGRSRLGSGYSRPFWKWIPLRRWRRERLVVTVGNCIRSEYPAGPHRPCFDPACPTLSR